MMINFVVDWNPETEEEKGRRKRELKIVTRKYNMMVLH